MTKKKITIIGGGIAGLTAALELTDTPELRAAHEVTVYQLGFRLGGKLASGRRGPSYANVEHGLHVWFGFYENAFRVLRRAYSEWNKDPRGPFQSVSDVVEPRSYTPLGYQLDGEWGLYPQLWFRNADEPGTGGVELSLVGVITQLLSALDRILLHALQDGREGDVEPYTPNWIDEALHEVVRELAKVGEELEDLPWMRRVIRLMLAPLRAVSDDLVALAGRTPQPFLLFLEGFARRIHRRLDALQSGPVNELFDWLLADYIVTILRGILNPRYGLLEGRDLDTLNDTEFTTWMRDNGASETLLESTLIRVIYETAFQYVEGDLSRPDVETGTCLRTVFRILFTYKGALLWEVRGGMGDVLIAPLYEVLRQRGVRFRLFHKLTHLGLSADKRSVEHIDFGLQARVRGGGEYEPLITLDYAPCWPDEPLWDQLDDGAGLCARGVDFESHWCQEPFAETTRLTSGVDFDQVVLATALGAFKPLNAEPGPCAELIEFSPRFRRMVDALGLVPSQALQLWMRYDLRELGFNYRCDNAEGMRPAEVDGPDPFNIWADMTQVLRLEQWRGNRPRSLHYLCGVLSTPLYREPSSNGAVPAQAHALVRAAAIDWLERYAAVYWPASASPGFDWNVLFDEHERSGTARIDGQYFRANIDPTACCVGTTVNTSQHRLGAGESGYDNLILAGSWTKTPMNVECVEAAVMSGMLASRAICGSPRHVVGEGFLRSL